jgi:uncharacterized protein YfkK (UPF0435 family)
MRCHLGKNGKMAPCHAEKKACPLGSSRHVDLKDIESVRQYNDFSGSDDYSHLSSHVRATIIRRGSLNDRQYESSVGDAMQAGDDPSSPGYITQAVRNGDAAAFMRVAETDKFNSLPDEIVDKTYERIVNDAAIDPESRSGENEEALQSIHSMFVGMRNNDAIDKRTRGWATYMAMKMERSVPVHYYTTVGA